MALVDLAARLSRALIDVELRVSCSSNEINFGAAIGQMPDLLELAYLSKQLETLEASRPPGDDLGLETEYNLLKAQSKAVIVIMQRWILRITAVSDITAQCAFSHTVPCGELLHKLPPSYEPEPVDISLQEVARGRSIHEWADDKMRSYQNNPRLRYKSQGELEQLIWNGLPPELQEWVHKPRREPLGFLRSYFEALKTPGFQTVLYKSLQTTRHNARAEMGNGHCQTCYPNLHRVIHKPRGSLWKKAKCR
jgi:hypothetical protein